MELNADSRWLLSNDDLFDHRKGPGDDVSALGYKARAQKVVIQRKVV